MRIAQGQKRFAMLRQRVKAQVITQGKRTSQGRGTDDQDRQSAAQVVPLPLLWGCPAHLPHFPAVVAATCAESRGWRQPFHAALNICNGRIAFLLSVPAAPSASRAVVTEKSGRAN
jgi:hypothetical protein